MNKLDRAILDAAARWAHADDIARRMPYGTERNVWTRTAERDVAEILDAARTRHDILHPVTKP